MQLLALEPGTWADWANAIATALAFTVALVLFVIGLRDRRRTDQDRRREQARHVWIWPGGMSGTLVEPGLIRQDMVDFTIENKSGEPISTPQAFIALEAMRNERPMPGAGFDLIRPGESKHGKLVYGIVQFESIPPPRLELYFLDSAGILWLRDSNGTLTESPKSLGQRTVFWRHER